MIKLLLFGNYYLDNRRRPRHINTRHVHAILVLTYNYRDGSNISPTPTNIIHTI